MSRASIEDDLNLRSSQSPAVSGCYVRSPRGTASSTRLINSGGNEKRKDIGEITVVALGPDMFIGLGLDQLRGNAHRVSALSRRAFQNIADAERTADPLHLGGLAL